MSTVLLFAILGAGSGAIYALGSLGIVLTYRGSGVINFASGAMGMVGTFAFYELHDVHRWPAWTAVIVGVAVSAALGLGTHLLMQPLRRASNLTRVVLTLALLVVITGLVGLRYPVGNSYTVSSLVPTAPVQIGGVGVGVNLLWTIVAAVLITALLGAAYRWTRFGLATSAAAEDAPALATLGWSPNLISGANWALGAALSGIAGILLSPIAGLSVGLASTLLLPSLAAAVLGNLRSFPVALAGGVGIGIAQAELQRYVQVQGLGDAVPFAAILLVIVLRGRKLPLRSYVSERLPRVTSGHIPVLRMLILALVLIALVLWILPLPWLGAITYTLTGAILLLSIVVVTGFAGQISLAQWAIAGCGALVTATLLNDGWPFVPAIVLGALSGLPIGLVVGAAALRARGMSLALATLAFSVCIVSLVLSNNSFNGGASGLAVGTFSLFGVDLDATFHPERYATFVVVVFVVLAVLVANLRRGRAGRRMLAVRANERAAAALGVNVQGAKLAGFCISAVIASIGGIVTVLKFPTALFAQFDTMTSINLVANGVFGGIGYTSGPLVGGVGQSGGVGSELLSQLGGSKVQYLTVIFGVLTVLVIMRSPDGVVPMQAEQNGRVADFVRRHLGRPKQVRTTELAATDRAAVTSGRARETTLEVDGLSVTFGGVKALTDVTLSLRAGEILGIIGPNGAGKTTVVDALAGFVTPRAGTIRLDGRDITGWSPRRRARAGIGRAFQSLELFEDMTVHENLLVASDDGRWQAWLHDLIWPGRPTLSSAAVAAVHDFGLAPHLDREPGELSYGKRRLLAIVRAIAANPGVLLLDEPAAGLDERERDELENVIRRLARDWGMAVLLIEHDVRLVSAVSDRMVALDFGEVVAAGTPEDVRDDPTVRRAYLGIEDTEPEPPVEDAPALAVVQNGPAR